MTPVREALAGRYELRSVLGRGGMGVVYAATDRVLRRTVAVKVLPFDQSADPRSVARFEREALAVAALSHPNIVSIYDGGCDEDTRYIVMECVRGLTVAELIAECGRLSPRRAVEIAAQVADALAAAHRAGIVHRDIKPANVMIDEAGRVKVLDFGIARLAAQSGLTGTRTILGSAQYLAPELTHGRPADARSDIYALGCVLYAMLTGGPPFDGDLAAAIMHQHIRAKPRPPRELNAATPPALDALVLGLLAKKPGDRPERAELLRPALLRSLEVKKTAATRARGMALGVLAAAAVALLAIVASSGPGSHLSSLSSPFARGSRPAGASRHHSPVGAHAAVFAGSRPSKHRASTSIQLAAMPASVYSAARTVGALVIGDLRAGTVDRQAAQQIFGPLQGAIVSYETGDRTAALEPVAGLAAQVAQLEQHGDVSSAAAGPLDAALANLQASLARTVAGSGAQGAGDAGGGGAGGGQSGDGG